MSLLHELKRRNVFRVGTAYVLAAWVLLQIADVVLGNIEAPLWVFKTLMLLAVLGFPVVLLFSWAFELTPDGIRRESDIDRSQSITRETGRKLDRVIIVFLALAVFILLADRFAGSESGSTPETATTVKPESAPAQATDQDGASAGIEKPPRPETEEQSIAVLPFVNMSSDPEQEFFSDGISEEILNVLTRIPNLKVAARTSSFRFKGRQTDAAEIGQQLQVNHLLEGSVRKSGTTLRITAQLIETDTGFHLWSKTFDRQLEDVFAVQDEIAAAIATELQASLSGVIDAPSATVDMAAYELYLKGRGLVAERKESSLLQAIGHLQTALEIDPSYAPALAMLATAYTVLPWFSVQMPAGEARERARNWATQALVQQPDNVDALTILGVVRSELDQDWTGAEILFKQALAINPGNLTANNFYGDFLTRTADFDRALIYEMKAAEMDPLSPVMLTDLAQLHIMRGEYDRATAVAIRARELDTYFPNAIQALGDCYYFLGDLPSLEALIRELEAVQGRDNPHFSRVFVVYALAMHQSESAGQHLAAALERLNAGQQTAVKLAFDMSLFGDFDTAGDLLLQAYAENDGTWTYPLYVRLPEQAPDSASWQEFWSKPGVAELADIRRSHGFAPDIPVFGSGARP